MLHLDVAFVPLTASFGPLEAVSADRGPAEADDLFAAGAAGLLAGAIELEALAVGDGALRPRPFLSDALFCSPPFLTAKQNTRGCCSCCLTDFSFP